jgi:hypothetical protein
MESGDARLIDVQGLDMLIAALGELGYDMRGRSSETGRYSATTTKAPSR